MKLTSFICGVALVAGVALTGSASAQPYADPNLRTYPRNGGGEAELQREISRLSQIIRAIQLDRHEDGGYRVRAIAELERAQEELRRAIQWDRSHGN